MDNNIGPPPVVPPGISPKLPESPAGPAKSKMQSFTKREMLLGTVAIILLLALGIWFVIFALGSARTPSQTVERYAEEGFVFQESIIQVGLQGDDDRSALFYISENKLACALLERSASGYHLVDTFGRLGLTGNQEGSWNISSLSGGKREIFLFGIIYDKQYTGVKVNGSTAIVVDTGKYRLWYFIAEGNVSISDGSVTYT